MKIKIPCVTRGLGAKEMTTEERKQFYLKALGDQRHLLRNAIAGMSAGDLTRALNVATTIRVLVHETGNVNPYSSALNRTTSAYRYSRG